MPAYDNQNIFAKILRGEIPCQRVFEDGSTLAFMDVMPQVDGHTLVIPKAACRNILDADPAIFAGLMATVQKVARAAQSAFNADGVLIRQFNEAAAGQTVFHLHVHVLPCHDGVALRPHTGPMADHRIMAEHARLIRAAL